MKSFFDGFKREAAAQPAPAYGQQQTAKPIYNNAKIRQLYEAHRRGEFANREAEWARIEANIFAAQRENRIQSFYLTK